MSDLNQKRFAVQSSLLKAIRKASEAIRERGVAASDLMYGSPVIKIPYLVDLLLTGPAVVHFAPWDKAFRLELVPIENKTAYYLNATEVNEHFQVASKIVDGNEVFARRYGLGIWDDGGNAYISEYLHPTKGLVAETKSSRQGFRKFDNLPELTGAILSADNKADDEVQVIISARELK